MIGGQKFNKQCEDYYELNVNHVDLDDHPKAIRTIERVLNKDLATQNPDAAFVGYNQYLRVAVSNCNQRDMYFIIGRKISEQKTYDPTLCQCGNSYCNEGETFKNCPSDCLIGGIFNKNNRPYLLLLIVLIVGMFLVRKMLHKDRASVLAKVDNVSKHFRSEHILNPPKHHNLLRAPSPKLPTLHAFPPTPVKHRKSPKR